jgi:hypothetical protein
MQRRDLKLGECVNAFDQYEALPRPSKKPLRIVASAYERNIERVRGLVLFPAVAISVASYASTIDAQQRMILRGSAEGKIKRKVAKEIGKFGRWRRDLLTDRDGDSRDFEKFEQAGAFKHLNTTSHQVRHGAEAWLAAQITGMWTAFEAMAEDLWVAALNVQPQLLANLRGDAKRLTADPRKVSELSGDSEKLVKHKLLQRYEYEISDHMGDILKSRYQFDSLSGIRTAYAEAFSEHSATIDTALKDGVLDAISALRNNLVHSGGVIDDEYVKKASRTASLPKGNVDSEIELDGGTVAGLVRPVLAAGQKLIKGVDSWIENEQKRRAST